MMLAAFQIILIVGMMISSVAAQSLSEVRNRQEVFYPGYCMKNWRGQAVCHEDSEKAWSAPLLEQNLAHILAPANHARLSFADRHLCSGILVGPDWVLTAASCVDNRNAARRYSVAFGFSGAKKGKTAEAGAIRPIKKIILNPDYKPNRNDLALVQFSEDPLVHIANPGLSPGAVDYPRPQNARFPNRGRADVPFSDITGQDARFRSFQAHSILYRWSRFSDTGRLALAATPLFQITPELCDQQRGRRDPKVNETVFCALSHERPLCPSDNGAPVMGGDQNGTGTYSPEEQIVVAIASWDRDECGKPGQPGRFTYIGPHREWIRETLANSFERRKKGI